MSLFILVYLIFILCFGGSVSAECAWILWSKKTFETPKSSVAPIREGNWEIEQSHTTLVACQKSLANAIETGKTRALIMASATPAPYVRGTST